MPPPLVLLVEYHHDMRLILRQILEREGYGVAEAATIPEAVAQGRLRRPDVILMDLAVPDLDARSAASELRAQPHLAGVPIVGLTADRHFEGGALFAAVLKEAVPVRTLLDTLDGLRTRPGPTM